MRDLDVKLPPWWSDQIEAAWNRSRDAALADWHLRGDRSMRIDAATIEDALAFGHGARSAYSHETLWDVVSSRLRADWTHLGHVGPAAWEHVVDVIRHEWLRAAGPGGDAPPS
jgi:hypothetical protein